MTSNDREFDEFDTDVPHAARVWNYWMGGEHHFPADRRAGDAVTEAYPAIRTMATESRRFLARTVCWLTAEAGVRQFLDLGAGLPTTPNTHEVARRFAPDARVLYVDHDPLVASMTRELRADSTALGAIGYLDADLRHTDRVVSEVAAFLDPDRPVAVMFMGVLGHLADFDQARSIVSTTLRGVDVGSFLVLWDGTATGDAISAGGLRYAEAGAEPYRLRTVEELASCFAGLEQVPPGLVPINTWRPDLDPRPATADPIDAHGAVARKQA